MDLKIAEIENYKKLGKGKKKSSKYLKINLNLENEKKIFILDKKEIDVKKIKGRVIILNNVKTRKINGYENEVKIFFTKNSKNEIDFLKPKNGKIGENLREENFQNEKNFLDKEKNFYFKTPSINKICDEFFVNDNGELIFNNFQIFLENGDIVEIDNTSSILF